MAIDLKTRNTIAQMMVDMAIGESKPIRKQHMVPLLKEINETTLIGHAMRFVSNTNGDVVEMKKYRATAIEKRINGK